MDFKDIPQFPRAHYTIDVSWDYLQSTIDHYVEQGLDMDPDYQRGHVWSTAQKVAYIEYVLKGGEIAKTIIINAPRWDARGYEGATLVDGKQRVAAILDFMANRVPVFGGHRYSDFTGRLRMFNARVTWSVVTLATRADLLQLYLNINAGGTPHTPEEIERVRALLAQEK